MRLNVLDRWDRVWAFHAGWVCWCAGLSFASWSEAQEIGPARPRAAIRGAIVLEALAAPIAAAPQDEAAPPTDEAAAEGQDDATASKADAGDEKRFPHGATLQTNPDIDEVLRKAQGYMDEGNYRAASRFWEAAVQRAGDQLYSTDGEIYYPLVRRIEEIIAKLPPEGLDTYRISADAAATEYLADDGTTQAVDRWQKVVNLAFLSSHGDKAALQLASHYLDRYQAIPAEMLLRRILEVYPDSKVPRDEVWMKLAIAYAISGDQTRGREALQQAVQARSTVTAAMLEQVASMLQTDTPLLANESATGGPQWTSSLGLGGEIQTMPDLPAGFLDRELAPVWMFQHQFVKQPRGKYIDGEVLTDPKLISETEIGSSTQKREFESVCRDWTRNLWQASSTPLVYDNKVLFKTQADLSIWRTENLSQQPVLRSLQLNRYVPDEISKYILEQSDQNRRNFPAGASLPYTSVETMQYFGDAVYQSMTVHNGIAYSVEGPSFSRESVYRDPGRNQPINAWSSPPIRDRTTYLQAYEISTGRTLWSKPFPLSMPDGDATLVGAAIVGPPVGYQQHVLVPVLASSRFWLVAVDGTSGQLVWKRTICDMPQLQPFSTTLVQLAVSGSDVFMVCGCGVMANVDASSGQLRWIRRYVRSIKELDAEGAQNQFFGGGMQQDWQRYKIEGWSHDLAVVWGQWVIVAASDTNFLGGYRRSTGELVWQAPRADVLGCTVDRWLGVRDGIVYATGARGLIAYELAAEGRLYGMPQRLEQPITGHGLLTSQGILLPVNDHLELYDLKSLAKIKDIPVTMPTKMPIGSLASDGSRLWIAAMNRLIAVEPVAAAANNSGDESGTGADINNSAEGN
ncbi:MAG: PQQ-binding-like beta-propeller repeat protein [Planctomycetaceae bacterium]|nr:PQQ-binding-like beta-propeller repeat protein [Planctomycetaceae bacterium]